VGLNSTSRGRIDQSAKILVEILNIVWMGEGGREENTNNFELTLTAKNTVRIVSSYLNRP
jgi:hypothetical protein